MALQKLSAGIFLNPAFISKAEVDTEAYAKGDQPVKVSFREASGHVNEATCENAEEARILVQRFGIKLPKVEAPEAPAPDQSAEADQRDPGAQA